VPAYTNRESPWPSRRLARFAGLPLIGPHIAALLASTPVLKVHRYPGDYYRFSGEAMREILLAGLSAIEVDEVLDPPRLIGSGLVHLR